MPRKSVAAEKTLPQGKQVYKLSTGYEFTATQVPSMIIYDAQDRYKFPEPPKVQISQGGQKFWVDNSNDSRYIEKMEEVQRQRNMAALGVMIEYGVHLYGNVPDDTKWLERVRRRVDLTSYEDENGEIGGESLEYLFLRYVAISTREDFEVIARAVTLTEEEVSQSVEMFPSD